MQKNCSLKLKKNLLKLSKKLSDKNVLSYSDIRKELGVDSKKLSKTIKTLHKEGYVTHKGRGKFEFEKERIEVVIFVYGSLKRGFDNNDILKDAQYLCKAETVRSFAMFEETSGNYPYLLKNENKGYSKIKGELYKICRKDILKKIDSFEGTPDYYKREKIKVKIKKKKIKLAETYFFTNNIIPKDQEPIEEWTKDNNYFLKVFEEHYKKSMCE